jgi:hypothetical protein
VIHEEASVASRGGEKEHRANIKVSTCSKEPPTANSGCSSRDWSQHICAGAAPKGIANFKIAGLRRANE